MEKLIYELVYIKDVDNVPSKRYTESQKNDFVSNFKLLTDKGYPCMARGVGKDGAFHVECRNGFDVSEIALTAKVNYGSGYNYTFIAREHYDGKYSIETKRKEKDGTEKRSSQIVAVKHEWRTLESLELERAEKDIDFYKKFESVLIKKEW